MYLSPWKFFRNQILLDYLGRWRNQSCQIFFHSDHSGVSGKGSKFAIFSAKRRWPLQLLYYRTTVIYHYNMGWEDTKVHVNVRVTSTFMVTRQGHGIKKALFEFLYLHNVQINTNIYYLSLQHAKILIKNTPPTERGLDWPRFGKCITIIKICFPTIFYTPLCGQMVSLQTCGTAFF